MKESINIVWLKRDLRLIDNEAIHNALSKPLKVLLIYILEPSIENDINYSKRHFRFIKQSILEMNSLLAEYNTEILAIHGDVIQSLQSINDYYKISNIFSHQETGIKITYDRDKAVAKYCKNKNIKWIENINNGVFRGITNRKKWRRKWEEYMSQPIHLFEPQKGDFVETESLLLLKQVLPKVNFIIESNPNFQVGGTLVGIRYLQSFFTDRYLNYAKHISKPDLGRKSCSRLSPYIAWG